MLDDSTNKFAIILRNEDLQNYAGDAFYNFVPYSQRSILG